MHTCAARDREELAGLPNVTFFNEFIVINDGKDDLDLVRYVFQ